MIIIPAKLWNMHILHVTKKLRQVIKKLYVTCVYAHNSRNFDLKFILPAINLSEWGYFKNFSYGKI